MLAQSFPGLAEFDSGNPTATKPTAVQLPDGAEGCLLRVLEPLGRFPPASDHDRGPGLSVPPLDPVCQVRQSRHAAQHARRPVDQTDELPPVCLPPQVAPDPRQGGVVIGVGPNLHPSHIVGSLANHVGESIPSLRRVVRFPPCIDQPKRPMVFRGVHLGPPGLFFQRQADGRLRPVPADQRAGEGQRGRQ